MKLRHSRFSQDVDRDGPVAIPVDLGSRTGPVPGEEGSSSASCNANRR